jgi:hypothetical protein
MNKALVILKHLRNTEDFIDGTIDGKLAEAIKELEDKLSCKGCKWDNNNDSENDACYCSRKTIDRYEVEL